MRRIGVGRVVDEGKPACGPGQGLGIPAGICYQRLTLGDTPESGYCIHALHEEAGEGIRLDARGNRESIQAEMDKGEETGCVPCEVGNGRKG